MGIFVGGARGSIHTYAKKQSISSTRIHYPLWIVSISFYWIYFSSWAEVLLLKERERETKNRIA
jgi:hypothetical protein